MFWKKEKEESYEDIKRPEENEKELSDIFKNHKKAALVYKKVRYMDRVEIMEWFYNWIQGKIKDKYTSSFLSSPFMQLNYTITLDNRKEVEISNKKIRIVKEKQEEIIYLDLKTNTWSRKKSKRFATPVTLTK